MGSGDILDPRVTLGINRVPVFGFQGVREPKPWYEGHPFLEKAHARPCMVGRVLGFRGLGV